MLLPWQVTCVTDASSLRWHGEEKVHHNHILTGLRSVSWKHRLALLIMVTTCLVPLRLEVRSLHGRKFSSQYSSLDAPTLPTRWQTQRWATPIQEKTLTTLSLLTARNRLLISTTTSSALETLCMVVLTLALHMSILQ